MTESDRIRIFRELPPGLRRTLHKTGQCINRPHGDYPHYMFAMWRFGKTDWKCCECLKITVTHLRLKIADENGESTEVFCPECATSIFEIALNVDDSVPIFSDGLD